MKLELIALAFALLQCIYFKHYYKYLGLETDIILTNSLNSNLIFSVS